MPKVMIYFLYKKWLIDLYSIENISEVRRGGIQTTLPEYDTETLTRHLLVPSTSTRIS